MIWAKMVFPLSNIFVIFILTFSVSVPGVTAKMCYRCQRAQTFSSNFTTSLFPLSKEEKPCILEKVLCSKQEHSCIYGLVSVVVSGGFWFHLSGCYVASVSNKSGSNRCFRGSGPVYWPGLTAEFRADYCLCSNDLCNDSRFDRSVVSFSLSRTGNELSEEPLPTSSSPTKYESLLREHEEEVASDNSSSLIGLNSTLVGICILWLKLVWRV
jgi:hypothetical protein